MSDLMKNPQEEAAALGMVVVTPRANQLFLDIDHVEDLDLMELMLAVLESNGVYVSEEKRTRSKSGNWHVYLRVDSFDSLDAMQRIALQACLGSDRTRELLSVLRVLAFDGTTREPTVFFEKPEDA